MRGNWPIEPFESPFRLLSNILLTFTLEILCRYKVGCDLPGKYRVALDSDALVFGGHGRVSNIARWQMLENCSFYQLGPKIVSRYRWCLQD
jgi:hypothetical protein